MEKRLVDPRDVEWEQDETCYRVYFWDKVNMTSHEYELTESTIEKALAGRAATQRMKAGSTPFMSRSQRRHNAGSYALKASWVIRSQTTDTRE